MNTLSKFFAELRRRGVFGTTAIYIVAAWVLIQVASEIFPAFNIPAYAIRYVWIGVTLGFPISLAIGWMYDISRDGVKRTFPAGASEDRSLKKRDLVVLSGFAVVATGLVFIMLGKIMAVREPPLSQPLHRATDPNSLAVLPLDNFTGDPEQAYFVAALHEALTAGLGSINSLKVISRTSTSVFAGSSKTIPEIGRELGVANIIEGSVFRSGDRVRITVQLIDALTDEHLWAENYERELTDLLSLQGEVARAIAAQVQVTLTPQENSRLTVERKVNPEIYELYLKGMYFINQSTPEGLQKGLPYLHQAVDMDPLNADAYAGLALGYNMIGHSMGRGAFPKAKAAARQALALDEYSGTAWAALAEAQMFHDYDWEESASSFKRALQLSPSLDHAHGSYAWLLALSGQWDRAFAEEEKTRELSPLDPYWQALGGWMYMITGDYEKSELLIRGSLELKPGYPAGLYALGQLYSAQGRFEEAFAVHEQIALGNPLRNWALGPSYAMAGRVEDALGLANDMLVDPGPKDWLHVAFIHASLGDFDEAMRWFEICYEARVDWLPYVALHNAYGGAVEGVRQDPRFQSLLDRLGLLNLSTTETGYDTEAHVN